MENNDCVEYIKQAFELKEQKCYKPAIEMLYKVLETENDNIEVLYQIGELYFLMKNFDRSVQYLDKVLTLKPSHNECLKLMAKINEYQGNLDETLEIYQKLYDENKNIENLKSLIKILIKLKLLTEIDNYKDSEFFNNEVKIDCANALYSNGETEKAKDFLAQCDSNDENTLLLQGKIEFDEHNFERAQEIFNRLGQNTQNSEILNFLGLFDLEKMNFIEAIKHFSMASNIDKNNAKYIYNLGNAYFYNGWIKEAQKAYSKALYLSPENLDYRYSLAYMYFDTKDFQKAQKEIDAILKINPEHSQARILNALLLAEKKDFLGAKKILEDNLIKGYDDDFTKISLSRICLELNIFDRAEKLIIDVIEQNPQNLNYINDLGEIYIKERSYDNALLAADKILELNSDYIAGYILGAKAAYLKGDHERAKNYAQNALSLDINCSAGYYYLALSREKTGDIEEAIECMKRAILYDLNNPEYYAKMSDLYSEKQDCKSALEYMSEAAKLDSTNEYKFRYTELVSQNRKNKEN